MSKIIFKLFVILIYLAFYLFLPSSVNAVSCNLVETNPTPINTDSGNATFKIDVGNNKEPGVTNWKMEFQCGVRYQQVDASTNPDSKTISATIQRSRIPGQGCEFSGGPHTIQIKAILNTSWVDWCVVGYNVIDSDSQCKLSIESGGVKNPTNNLTVASTITVSGDNLTRFGQFGLFIDKDNNKISPGIFVNTPNFSGITIPKEHLSPNKHTLYLKKYDVAKTIGSSGNPSFGGPPLCPLEFTVETSSAPGSVTGRTAGGSSGTKSPPTSGGGDSCDDNKGIKTAIGCVHTSPVGFIKDFLNFAVGISGGLAFLMMLLGAFQMLTSAGNPETLQAGRERLQSAVIGLLFVIFAVLLLKIIGVDILGIPGFK